MSIRLILGILMALFVGSQIFWLVRARALLQRLAKTRTTLILAAAAGLAAYLGLFAVNFGVFGSRSSPTRLTWYDALIAAPFHCWVVCSLAAFLLAALVWPVRRLVRSSGALVSPGLFFFHDRSAT